MAKSPHNEARRLADKRLRALHQEEWMSIYTAEATKLGVKVRRPNARVLRLEAEVARLRSILDSRPDVEEKATGRPSLPVTHRSVRSWARSMGMDVQERGPLSREIIDAFKLVHGIPAAR